MRIDSIDLWGAWSAVLALLVGFIRGRAVSTSPPPTRAILLSGTAQFLIQCVLLLTILFSLVLCYVKINETNKWLDDVNRDQKLLQIYFQQLEKTVIKGGRP